jgi:hypothetical protein
MNDLFKVFKVRGIRLEARAEWFSCSIGETGRWRTKRLEKVHFINA